MFLNYLLNPNPNKEKLSRERTLLKLESSFGKKIFGKIPNGSTREFFCLDEKTWVWSERSSSQHQMTRYILRANDIIKTTNNQDYKLVSKEEAQNLIQAIKEYVKIMRNEYTLILKGLK